MTNIKVINHIKNVVNRRNKDIRTLIGLDNDLKKLADALNNMPDDKALFRPRTVLINTIRINKDKIKVLKKNIRRDTGFLDRVTLEINHMEKLPTIGEALKMEATKKAL